MTQNVEWRPVKGFEGLYEVNNTAQIRTVERTLITKNGNRRTIPSKLHKPSTNVHGYHYVKLIKDGKQKNMLNHRAVMEAFVPNPENKPFIDHINTIKTDNRLENLRWVTSYENSHNPITIQHIKDTCTPQEISRQIQVKKENGSWNAKRVFQYTKEGVFVAEYASQSDAIKALGLDARRVTGNLKTALDNNKKSAYGFMWTTKKVSVPEYIKPHGKYSPIRQIDKNGNTIREWKSVSEAAKSLGVWDSNLSSYVKKYGSYKGMLFQYIDNPSSNT